MGHPSQGSMAGKKVGFSYLFCPFCPHRSSLIERCNFLPQFLPSCSDGVEMVGNFLFAASCKVCNVLWEGGTAQLSQHAEQVSQSARRQPAVPIVHLWVVSASSAFIRFRQWLESCQWLGSSMEANPWLQRAAYLVLKFSTVFGALSLFGGKALRCNCCSNLFNFITS